MKELSIEDKAKRYDEAIKFAYNKHRFSSNLSEIKLIEELFPELKEDEREIPISEHKSAEEYNITGIGSKNAQGKLGEMIKRKLEIEKQCEQKPAIKLERDDNGEAVLTPFEAELFSMMSEAWQGYSFGEEVNIAKIVKEHSKELLERANEHNPAWSEEDEERYISCLQRLGTGNPEQPETINSKWFKEHVYPKSYWKPSDEQIRALDAVIDEYNGYPEFDSLVSLKNDLMKLNG